MKLKLLSLITALLCSVGSWAYTTTDLTSAGWTVVTSDPTADEVAANYYVFVNANGQSTMIGMQNNPTERLTYQTLVNPATDTKKVWILETSDTKYAFRNIENDQFLLSTANGTWNFTMQTSNEYNNDTKFTFAYSDGKWNIQNCNANSDNYVGPWDGNGGIVDEKVAANKGTAANKGFIIYSISRSEFKRQYLSGASSESPKDATTFITNHSFESNSKRGWTDDTTGDKIDIISTDALSGKDGTSFAERWWYDSSMDIYQTTADLPAGWYRITVYAKAETDNSMYLYGQAGSNTEVTQSITENDIKDYSLEVYQATAGGIKLGFKGEHKSQTHVAFDNFRLTYLGNPLGDINAKITEVGTLTYAKPDKKPSVYIGTSASDAASHVSTQIADLRTYVESNALAEGVEGATDYTSSISEALCAATAKQNGNDDIYNGGTWSYTRVRANGDQGYTNAAGEEKSYYFDSNGRFWDNSYSNASMSQTVSGLPAGKYLLTVCSRSEKGSVLTLSANDESKTCSSIGSSGGVFDNGWNDTSVEFNVGNAGTAEISLTGTKGSAGHPWLSADNFRLVRLGDLDGVTPSDNVAWTPEDQYADFTLNRTFGTNWSTLVLPFDIDNATLKEKFGDDVRVSEFSADDKTGVKFTPMAEPAITANKPVLIKANTEETSFEFNGVTIKSGTPTVTESGVNFVGNYGGDIILPAGSYYVKSNTLKKATEDGKQKLLNFRAYFTVDADSPVKAFFEYGFDLDDETSIEVIDNDSMRNGEIIYNMAGQRVSKAQKGLYIVNGRKVVIK